MILSIFNFKRVPYTLRRGKFPRGLVATIMGIVIIELFITLLPQPPYKDLIQHRFYNTNVTPGIAESVVQWQVAHAMQLNETQDILLLGGSACLGNLDAVLLTEMTGMKTWNLGTFGFIYTEGHADLLQFFIKHNGPPRFLVYHTSHEPLSTGRRDKEVKIWLGRLREWIAVPKAFNSLLPSLHYRQQLRNDILNFGEENVNYTGLDRPRGIFGSDQEIRRILWEKRGTGAGFRIHGSETRKNFPERIVWNPRFHPDCIDGLQRIFALAQEHGFPVLIQYNPLPRRADNDMVRKAVEGMKESLEKAIEPYPFVSLYRPFLRFYPDDYCIDMRHLTEKGRHLQTEELAVWILNNWIEG